ncbi:mitochondrial metal transporter [Coemansia sp. RSA 2610]|nr:mitochondrial metal transporter [Coemansia sp. RSA 2610]
MNPHRIGSMLLVQRRPVLQRLRSKHTAAGKAGTRWSTADLAALRDAASSFSSLSTVLDKQRHHQEEGHTHGHGLFSAHAHTHDSRELAGKLDMMEHNKAGSRITLIGMGANVGMSVAKGAAGVYFHSSALLADAAHSLSDILGDLVTLYTFRKSRRPADVSHPFGYGRYEALGTLVVSAFLVAAGLGIGSHALEQIMHFLPDVLGAATSAPDVAGSARDLVGAAASTGESLLPFGHAHGAPAVADGAVAVDPRAIWFAAGSIVINEALFLATMKVGRRTKSNVLVANAWHHRSDALTSLVSVGAIAGAIMGFPVLDAVGGLAVSVMLARSGVTMMADAAREVTDAPPPGHSGDEVARALDRVLAQTATAVRGHGRVQCRKSGPFIHVRVALRFDAGASAGDVARAIAQVRSGLRAQLGYVQDIDVDIEIR